MTVRRTGKKRNVAPAVLMLAISGGLAHAGGTPPLYHATELGPMVEEAFPGVTWPSSDGRALNENGDLAGEGWKNGSQMQGFVYTVEHGITKLPLIPNWPSTAVRDISDRDENGDVIIVGCGTYGVHTDIAIGPPCLWRYSTVTNEVLETRVMTPPPGYDDGMAIAVSNDGLVAGFSGIWDTPHTNWKYDIATGVLETFDFPARIQDMNNFGQVCGGTYRGDTFGNYEDLSDTYEPGDVMPEWAIENGGISAGWYRINDLGWVVGRAGTGISDGAGHYLVDIVRFADPIGWTGMDPGSHLSLAGGINELGDFMDRNSGVYFEDLGQVYGFSSLLSDDFPQVSMSWSYEMNSNRQVVGSQAHALLFTPLGTMIIPGDVNGDVTVDLDDYCAWVAAPIDLDGDGDVDADDDQWLRDRLAVFDFTVDDCNGNGVADHCDIVDGTNPDCDGNDVPDECQPDCNGDGVPDSCEDDCNDNGIPDPCDIADGTSDDCNDNGIPDECDGGGVTEASRAYDPPMLMLQGNTVVEHLVIFDVGIVDDLNLTLNVRYRLGDMTMRLSHNGTTVTIFDRPGYPQHNGGFVNFGYDAIIDDEGTGPYLEFAGDACCSFEWLLSPPSYRPDAPGNPGFAAFDGMPVEGVWSLEIITEDHYSPGEGLIGWGLSITRAAAEIPPCCTEDVDGSGAVDLADLLDVLANWGTCVGCPADFDGNGAVDSVDLLAVMASWGPCD